MPVKPTAPFRIRCVCGESIKVIGHANSTVDLERCPGLLRKGGTRRGP